MMARWLIFSLIAFLELLHLSIRFLILHMNFWIAWNLNVGRIGSEGVDSKTFTYKSYQLHYSFAEIDP